jgi:long-subunit fatty acid transport protein
MGLPLARHACRKDWLPQEIDAMGRFKPSVTKFLVCLGVVSILPAFPLEHSFAASTNVEITSSPNPVGSGARALGMGGAFIAVADDATAASWNPGGLVQLERPEVSVVGEASHLREKNSSGNHPEVSGRQSVSGAGLNYLSATYPFTLFSHNMVVSLSYQHLYDFSRQWNLNILNKDLQVAYDYDANGGLYAYGISYSVQVIPELSFGFTLNLWQDGIYRNGWETVMATPIRFSLWTANLVQKDRYSFTGFNANLGMLWNVTDKLTMGAVFKTPFTADLEHKRTIGLQMFLNEPWQAISSSEESKTTSESLDMPMSYGIGLAYRLSDRLTLSADLNRTEWQDFVLTDATGRRISPITNKVPKSSDIDPTMQFHLGAEYLLIQPKYTVPLRAGFFYDPAPAQGSPDDYYGFSLGTGIGVGRFIFDVAYVYRFGRDVGATLVPTLKFSQDVDEHALYTSLIIHF